MPQGSILGSLFFPVYINDLTVNLKCYVKHFADDRSLFTVASTGWFGNFVKQVGLEIFKQEIKKIAPIIFTLASNFLVTPHSYYVHFSQSYVYVTSDMLGT